MTYDHITDQFSKDLSPLAKRMYAVIFEATSHASHGTYIAGWDITKILGEDTGLGSVFPSAGEGAMTELILIGLVRELRTLGCRYELTTRAWRAHLLAAQQAKEETP